MLGEFFLKRDTGKKGWKNIMVVVYKNWYLLCKQLQVLNLQYQQPYKIIQIRVHIYEKILYNIVKTVSWILIVNFF